MCRLFVFSALTVLAGLAASPVRAGGSLVKASATNAVYYVAADAKRYVFPNERIYASWYPDFSTVTTITDDRLAQYPIGGNITYRPGTRLVKLMSDPKVYAVETGGVLRWVRTEEIAKALFGDAWAMRVDDLSDAFFPAYRIGLPLDLTTDLQSLLGIDDGAEDFDPAESNSVSRQIVAVKAEANPHAASIFQDSSGQVIGDFTFSLSQPTEIRSLDFTIHGDSSSVGSNDPGGLVRGDGTENIEPVFSNIRMADAAGASLLGSASLLTGEDGDKSQRISLTGSATLPPGRHRFQLLADVSISATLRQQYHATLRLDASRFFVDGTETAAVSPLTLEGNAVTVEELALSVSLLSTSKDQFAIKLQVTAIDAVGFHLLNPTNAPLTVTEFVVTGYVDEGEGSDDFQAGADADDGGMTLLKDIVTNVEIVSLAGAVLGTSANVGSDGTVRFEGLSWAVPAQTALDVNVRVTLNGSAPYELGSDRIAFDIADPKNDISVRDANGQEVDVSGSPPNGASNPNITVSIAKGGSLTISGSGSAPARFIMGEETSAYGFSFKADKAESIMINTLTVRLTDPSAGRSLLSGRLTFTGPDGVAHDTIGQVSVGNITFANPAIVLPPDVKVDAFVYLTIQKAATGAVSGDRIGLVFEPSTFKAHGVTSGYAFDEDDMGTLLTDNTTISGSSPVRKNVPVVTRSAAQPPDTGSEAPDSALLRFKIRSSGDGSSTMKKLTFKIVPSDAGFDLNDVEADNDLLEVLADLNGDGADDNAIADLVDLEDDEVLGEGGDGHIDYAIYDNSLRLLDETPAGLDTEGLDYGLLTYTFPFGLNTSTMDREYELRLDTRGLENGPHSVKVTLIDGADFLWSDGTASGANETGIGVSNLPVVGNALGF